MIFSPLLCILSSHVFPIHHFQAWWGLVCRIISLKKELLTEGLPKEGKRSGGCIPEVLRSEDFTKKEGTGKEECPERNCQCILHDAIDIIWNNPSLSIFIVFIDLNFSIYTDSPVSIASEVNSEEYSHRYNWAVGVVLHFYPSQTAALTAANCYWTHNTCYSFNFYANMFSQYPNSLKIVPLMLYCESGISGMK